MESATMRALKSLHLHLLENAQMDAEQASVEREVEKLEVEKAGLERERLLLKEEHERLKHEEAMLEEVEMELKRQKASLDVERRRLADSSVGCGCEVLQGDEETKLVTSSALILKEQGFISSEAFRKITAIASSPEPESLNYVRSGKDASSGILDCTLSEESSSESLCRGNGSSDVKAQPVGEQGRGLGAVEEKSGWSSAGFVVPLERGGAESSAGLTAAVHATGSPVSCQSRNNSMVLQSMGGMLVSLSPPAVLCAAKCSEATVLARQLNKVLVQEGAVVALIRRAICQHKAVLARCDRASQLYDSLLAKRDVVTAQYNKVLTLKRQIIDEMKAFKAERDSLFFL